jgi:hypothetical protein
MSEEESSGVDLPVESTQPIQPPIEIAGGAVTRLNREGLRYSWEPLQIIDESREAMHKMPQGKSGIVLGSGPNTEAWKQRGWLTLDIDPSVEADLTIDANLMEQVVPPNSQDFILAEFIRFQKGGVGGVGPGRLLLEANKALKDGGRLIIQSAHKEGVPTSNLPDRNWYANSMTQHGFEVIEELQEIRPLPGNALEQRVTYYGVKKYSGFDATRGKL